MKKLKCLAVGVLPIFAASASVDSNYVEKSTIIININNNQDYDLTSARLKLDATNEWINLPDIHSGNNTITVNVDNLNNVPGLIQVVTKDADVLNASFTKTKDDQIINLEIDSDSNKTFDNNVQNINTHSLLLSETNSNNTKSIGSTKFSPISAQLKNNSWSAACSGGVNVGVASVTCEIFSDPRIAFIGEGYGGTGGSVFGGSFGATKNPRELVSNSRGGWSLVAALFYSHIEAPDGWFNGGGIGIGGGGGDNGYYIYR
jgi:hypothetical protein